jgi:hypothetical protein
LWLNFPLISINKAPMGSNPLGFIYVPEFIYITLRCWYTLSWVLGLIQYRNNNLNNVIGIVSDLYWMLIKYVDKIINPLNGYFSYNKWYSNLRMLLDYIFYTWTSTIKDPSERYTPCIDVVPLDNYRVYYRYQSNSKWGINIILYKSKPGSPIFNNLSLKFAIWYDKFNVFQLYDGDKNAKNKNLKWLKDNLGINKSLFNKCFAWGSNNYKHGYDLPAPAVITAGAGKSSIIKEKIKLPIKLKVKVKKDKLNINKNLSFTPAYTRSLKYKKRISDSYNNTSQGYKAQSVPCLKKKGDNNNKVKDKITEKNKTKSRSNKWKFIISEKSRKHIIFGCKGKTYLEKVEAFYKSWWNYYLIRECNTGKILYEYHSYFQKSEINKGKNFHSPFNPPYNKFPRKIREFLNYSNKFLNYSLKNRIGIINDITIDQYTELYSYCNNRVLIQNDILKLNPKDSNIEQYYSFCNNRKVFVGWVSIIRIKGYSFQLNYFNNLIKRYHKEWINMLKNWVVVPNVKLEWNSNTKNKNTAFFPSSLKTKEVSKEVSQISNPKIEETSSLSCNQGIRVISKLGFNLNNELNLPESTIPKKYQNKFNYVKISIKSINIEDHKVRKNFAVNIKMKNKLPWAIKESILFREEREIKEIAKIPAKFR